MKAFWEICVIKNDKIFKGFRGVSNVIFLPVNITARCLGCSLFVVNLEMPDSKLAVCTFQVNISPLGRWVWNDKSKKLEFIR